MSEAMTNPNRWPLAVKVIAAVALLLLVLWAFGVFDKKCKENSDCENGTCDDDGTCQCNPGYALGSGRKSNKCVACDDGYDDDGGGNCVQTNDTSQ
jgi:hypothetical protein